VLFIVLEPFPFYKAAWFTWSDRGRIGRMVRRMEATWTFVPEFPLSRDAAANIRPTTMDQMLHQNRANFTIRNFYRIRETIWSVPLKLFSVKQMFDLA
jgi:hypothetical protein